MRSVANSRYPWRLSLTARASNPGSGLDLRAEQGGLFGVAEVALLDSDDLQEPTRAFFREPDLTHSGQTGAF